jgi:hypothetical protein
VCFVAYYFPLLTPLEKYPLPNLPIHTNDFSRFDKHIIGSLLDSGCRDLRRGVSSV